MATIPQQTTEIAVKLRLSGKAGQKLAERAAQSGRDVAAYASDLIEHAVAAPDIDEVLEPLRREFAQSGTTDDQLITQINEARDEYHAQRSKSNPT